MGYKLYSNREMTRLFHLYNPHNEGLGNKGLRPHKNPCPHNIHHIVLIHHSGTLQCLGKLGLVHLCKLHLGNKDGEGIINEIYLLNHSQPIHSIPKTKEILLAILYLNFNHLYNLFNYKIPLDLLN